MLCKIWSCYDNATISTGGTKPNHYHSNNCRRRPRMDSAFKPGPPYPYGKRLRSRVSLEFRSGDAGLTRLFSNSSSLVCFRSPWARSAPVQGKSNTHSRPSPQAKQTPSPSFTGNRFRAPADSNMPLLTASRAGWRTSRTRPTPSPASVSTSGSPEAAEGGLIYQFPISQS